MNGPRLSAEYVAWEHDHLCESENVHGHDTPCWCEERAVDGYVLNPAQFDGSQRES